MSAAVPPAGWMVAGRRGEGKAEAILRIHASRVVGVVVGAAGTPATRAATLPARIAWEHDEEHRVVRFSYGGKLLAVYNDHGNTFEQFYYGGVNLIGGFAESERADNGGPGAADRGKRYPHGWRDGQGNYPDWQGFWAGFGYMDRRTTMWEGVAGNPFARQKIEIRAVDDEVAELHVSSVVGPQKDPLFRCDVRYYISAEGIGAWNQVTLLRDIEPVGWDDTGGQRMPMLVEKRP